MGRTRRKRLWAPAERGEGEAGAAYKAPAKPGGSTRSVRAMIPAILIAAASALCPDESLPTLLNYTNPHSECVGYENGTGVFANSSNPTAAELCAPYLQPEADCCAFFQDTHICSTTGWLQYIHYGFDFTCGDAHSVNCTNFYLSAGDPTEEPAPVTPAPSAEDSGLSAGATPPDALDSVEIGQLGVTCALADKAACTAACAPAAACGDASIAYLTAQAALKPPGAWATCIGYQVCAVLLVSPELTTQTSTATATGTSTATSTVTTTEAPAPVPPAPPAEDSGLSAGAIAGIAVGAVLAVVAAGVWLL